VVSEGGCWPAATPACAGSWQGVEEISSKGRPLEGSGLLVLCVGSRVGCMLLQFAAYVPQLLLKGGGLCGVVCAVYRHAAAVCKEIISTACTVEDWFKQVMWTQTDSLSKEPPHGHWSCAGNKPGVWFGMIRSWDDKLLFLGSRDSMG
jgi:hypothetical protein